MPTDKQLDNLVINKLSKAKYQELQNSNSINENELYFITDSDDAAQKQDKITGNVGDFVVIGEDGNVTTKSISRAEEVEF
jgi:hypothetical protein